MRVLYTIGILLYSLGVRLASLFNEKARQMVRGWRQSHQIISQQRYAENNHTVAWFHAASLGEFEQARPVMEKYKANHPDHSILLTFFSPSGYEIRHNYKGADVVCYLPMDTISNARKLVQTFRPSVAFFVKYDFWFNYLDQLHKFGTRTYIFSAIFRKDQYFFKWYGGWFLKQLQRCYSHIFVQNSISKELLNKAGITNCTQTGDTRFDRVHDIAMAAQRFEKIESFINTSKNDTQTPIIMAGSSWEPDERNLHTYLNARHDSLRMIIAPHVISESHIEKIIQLFGQDNCLRYTQIDNASTTEMQRQVLIVDTMGMLSALYQYATIAYIGGGFGRGIHNTLEAVTFDKPVVFGPNHIKFQEALDLKSRKAGFSYSTYDELETILNTLLNNKETYEQAVEQCNQYMKENLGSTDKILAIADR